MPAPRNAKIPWLAAAMTATAMMAATLSPSLAGTCLSQERVTSDGSLSSLAQIRVSCPLLGTIVEEFAMRDLGESFPRSTLHSRAAAKPVAEDISSFARRAREARDAGATVGDFEEVLYLTAVTVGIPKAVAATRVLLDLFAERESQCPGAAVRAGLSF